ncbi:MAG: hypothetical protein F6J97_00520 [Leptolyngbya sp. SIO4C1]|nr:hypothetical protein [Leptolyngbya sp. SIO4C1]
MFQPIGSGADVPTDSSAPTDKREPIRLLMFGSLAGVQSIIKSLHKRQFAEPNDWSQPIPTERPGEVMVTLTKYRHQP